MADAKNRYLPFTGRELQPNLTVTLRDYPTPHHTSWRKIAKHTEIMHMRHAIPKSYAYNVCDSLKFEIESRTLGSKENACKAPRIVRTIVEC